MTVEERGQGLFCSYFCTSLRLVQEHCIFGGKSVAAVFYSGTTMVLEGVSASEMSSNLFLMKLTREFEKVGAKLKKSEANSMAKVLKHLEKRLAYVKDPASFIAKNESLKDSYEQFKESNVFSLELHKYVFTKCLNMFQHVIDMVAPEFQNGTHGAEVDKENSQGGSCELPVPPGKKIELWEGISNRAMLESYGLRAVFVDLLTSLKDIAASSDVDDSLYFVFYFDILRDSLARTTGAAQFQDVFRVTADTFKERIACASSGTLRKIANFAYQMAVHSTREKRLFSAFRSNIFSAVFSLEAMGTASKVDAKFEKTAYTRYQHAFSLFKKIIAAKETTSASVCENVLNKLSLSLLCFVSFHFTSKTNEDVVRVVNLIVANQARCQREIMSHDTIFDVAYAWNRLAHKVVKMKATSVLNTTATSFLFNRAAESYEFYAVGGGKDAPQVCNLSVAGYRCTQNLVQKLSFPESDATLIFHRALYTLKVAAFMLNVPRRKQQGSNSPPISLTNAIKKYRTQAASLISQGNEQFRKKSAPVQHLAIAWNMLLEYAVSGDSDNTETVRAAADALKSVTCFSEADISHTWYLFHPTVRLIKQVGTMLGAFKHHLLQLELYSIALGWERETKEEIESSLYSSVATVGTVSKEYHAIRYEGAKLYFEEGYSLVSEQIVDRMTRTTVGKDDLKTMCLAAVLRAFRPRGQSEYLARLKNSLDAGKHPLQSKSRNSNYRTVEEAGWCTLALSKLHNLVGNTHEAFYWAKKSDAYYHNARALFVRGPDGEAAEFEDGETAPVPLSAFSTINEYTDFLFYMNTLFQKRAMPSCSSPYVNAGIELAKHLRSDSLKGRFQFQYNLLHARCDKYASKANPVPHLHGVGKLTGTLEDAFQSLGHAEECCSLAKPDRASVSLKKTKSILSARLRRSGNSIFGFASMFSYSQDASKEGEKLSLKDCHRIRSAEFVRSDLNTRLAIARASDGKPIEGVQKMLEKSRMLSSSPSERIFVYAAEAMIRSSAQGCTYYQSLVSKSWPIFMPHLLRPILKGYAAKLLRSETKETAALVGTMSIGLPYDLGYYQNVREANTGKKPQGIAHDPTTASFESTLEYNQRSLEELQKREQWDMLSLYFDDKEGIVVSSFSCGSAPKVSVVPFSKSSISELQTKLDILLQTNDETLESATGISSTDNKKKKDWWASRFALDKEMASLINTLEATVRPAIGGRDGSLESHLETMSLKADGAKRPIVLLLDHNLQRFPWESISSLRSRHVTRMPSLSSVLSLWKTQRQKTFSICRNAYVVNPENNLPSTEANFKAMKDGLEKKHNIQSLDGLVGEIPTTESIIRLLKASDVLIYWGHDSVLKFTRTAKIAKERFECVVFDMGCNSGRLYRRGTYGVEGKVLSLLMAGSPAIVSNLWKVSTGDCDIFGERLVKFCAVAEGPVPLNDALSYARAPCDGKRGKSSGQKEKKIKLASINGAATVCYGLPVTMKR